ncbi:phosphotransferase enzyme family protein [Pelagibacterium xiamenense]|uniref:phosphotransferase enzyme family protein n=1 Tax=Pelagibacterium xiamenense TaxID=2901140 RepID=UPI001E346448|nr:phosphotransferase [Pelagibacterium xiamenense]MCD7060806.1 phosphotransferase [Pelagibacterium xiamenense]
MLAEPLLDAALANWSGLEGSTATLINLSENHTFRIDTPTGEKYVLRVHRPDYHSRLAIESELAWMRALNAETGLFTPQPIRGDNGAFVQQGPFGSPNDVRHMVLFEFEAGTEPEVGDDLAPVFSQLGALAAQCHAHVERWTPPEPFERQVWTAEAILDRDAIWGDWRRAPGVTGAIRKVLDTLDEQLRLMLASYGRTSDRFGLIHADMRLANLLVEDGVTRIIDFDDCGFCWFGYDFAAAVSFFEDDPVVPALREAWLAGYRRHRDFSREDAAMLDTLIMLRRMALLAWTGSHDETELARSLAPTYAQGTADLAERYLKTGRIDR